MAQVKAVFFDVNGTLWDDHACALHVMEVVVPRFTPPLPEVKMAEVIRRFNAVFLDMPRRPHIRDRKPFSRLRRFEALVESFDVRKRDLAREMNRVYDSVRRLVMRKFLDPDAHAVLTALGRRGVKRGVILNGAPAAQRHLVQSLGLEPLLDHVVLGEVEGHNKPDARLFRRALEVAGVEPGEAAYVGDSPLTDVLGAARAGIKTLWLDTGRRCVPRGWPVPDHTIACLGEVLDIV